MFPCPSIGSNTADSRGTATLCVPPNRRKVEAEDDEDFRSVITIRNTKQVTTAKTGPDPARRRHCPIPLPLLRVLPLPRLRTRRKLPFVRDD